jgi:putative alpha-1,2-mannosidase
MSRLCLPVFFLLTAVTSAAFAQSAYDSVDPVIGTSGDGNTIPGASLPSTSGIFAPSQAGWI